MAEEKKRNAPTPRATAWWRRVRSIAATTATTRPARWKSHATAITPNAKLRLPQPERECRLFPAYSTLNFIAGTAWTLSGVWVGRLLMQSKAHGSNLKRLAGGM